MRRAEVYILEHLAGLLEEQEDGYVFSYEKNYLNRKDAIPISLSLPLQVDPLKDTRLFPFFDGVSSQI